MRKPNMLCLILPTSVWRGRFIYLKSFWNLAGVGQCSTGIWVSPIRCVHLLACLLCGGCSRSSPSQQRFMHPNHAKALQKKSGVRWKQITNLLHAICAHVPPKVSGMGRSHLSGNTKSMLCGHRVNQQLTWTWFTLFPACLKEADGRKISVVVSIPPTPRSPWPVERWGWQMLLLLVWLPRAQEFRWGSLDEGWEVSFLYVI